MARRLSTWVIVAALVASLVAVARADEDVCLNYRAREVMCPADYRPVCGSDGVTYGNQCAFMAAKCNLKGALTSVDGECPDAFECPTMCDMMYSPFCGTDGQTYGNLCTLIAARCSMARDKGVDRALLSVESEGECGPAACIDSYEPVCASNGETFSNDCMLQAAARERGIVLSVLHAGICKPVNECETMCTDEIQPVCGTNGVTYSNECALNAARCTEGKEWLSVFERGSCDDLCPDMCTEMYAPVCSNTGVTFSGFCQFFQARCEARKQGLLAPTIERLGECATIECPPIDCIEVDQPVCGTDRVTYSNPCELVRASCKNADLSVCHEGRCAPKEEPRCSLRCDKKLDEVCGSDGETYRNPCLLNAEACLRHQRITIASRGPCNSIDMPVENDDDEEQDVCANVECEEGYQCVPEQRECFAPPCPQYTCARRACEPAMPVDPVPMCEQMCTMEYRPVCGSDGMIYSSLCNLESAACFRNAQGFDQLVPREHLTDCKCACFDQLFRQGWASFAGDKTSMDYFDFAAIVTAMGATPEQATSMFALMDTNGDGVLTKEEFTVYQSAETPSSGSEDDMSWYYYVVFSLGAVLGVVLLTVGFAFIFRSNKHSPTVTQPLLG